METIKKTSIHRLTQKFAEVESEHYVMMNGREVKLNLPNNPSSYVNRASERERLQREQPENIVTAVFAVWGNTPTVAEPTPPAWLTEQA